MDYGRKHAAVATLVNPGQNSKLAYFFSNCSVKFLDYRNPTFNPKHFFFHSMDLQYIQYIAKSVHLPIQIIDCTLHCVPITSLAIHL